MFEKEEPASFPSAMSKFPYTLPERVCMGLEAMKRAGAQKEFVAANMLLTAALGCCVILRAGEPPQYDKKRSPKSGLNLSKTSNQGLLKGTLPKEERFSRLDDHRNPRAHHPKDAAHLALKPTDIEYQHCMPLDINLFDIIRELELTGDLMVLGFDASNCLLRLGYKEGRGPAFGFHGQFVIDFSKGFELPQFYSRDWNHPETHPEWDPEQQTIKKPLQLSELPDALYQLLFNQTFYLGYTEDQSMILDKTRIKKVEVFANRLRNAADFKKTMGQDHPCFEAIQSCTTLEAVLKCLQLNFPEKSCQIITDVYDKSSTVIAGDWDGLMLGYSPVLDTKFSEVINVFEPGLKGIENQERLLSLTEEYFLSLKKTVQLKRDAQQPLFAFEQKIMSIESVFDVISDFALARAGCITAHEFLFQQMLNDDYRDQRSVHYGDQQNSIFLQKAMDILLSQVGKRKIAFRELRGFIRKIIEREFVAQAKSIQEFMLTKYVDHVLQHFIWARHLESSYYVLPHLLFDMNVQDLYQHGFDMRNPYGTNLDGAWLFISDEGCVFYGSTQEELIALLLTGDFLKSNCFDLHHDVDLSKGWDKIIAKQLELGHKISPQMKKKYDDYMQSLSPMPYAFFNVFEKIEEKMILKASLKALKEDSECIIKEDSLLALNI